MELPVYFQLGGVTTNDETWLLVNRGPTTFHISVRFSSIEKTSWGRKYLQKIGRLSSEDDAVQLKSSKDGSDLLISQCLPLMLSLAPISSIQELSVETLCTCPTYRLAVEGKDDEIYIDGADRVTYEPGYGLSPIAITELHKSCDSVVRVPASSIRLAAADGPFDPRAVPSPQGKAFTADGKAVYFKPRFGEQFEREIAILSRILELGLHRHDSNRFPRLLGLVVTGKHGELAVGMLIELISCGSIGGDLLSTCVQGRTDMYLHWKAQVVNMVKELHAHDLVWGDVNAGNVVIDETLNAWVIDFGGLNNPEFVDDELAETKEGDWQGLDRLFDIWLSGRVVDGSC